MAESLAPTGLFLWVYPRGLRHRVGSVDTSCMTIEFIVQPTWFGILGRRRKGKEAEGNLGLRLGV